MKEWLINNWNIIDNYIHGHSAMATIIGSIVTLVGTVCAMIFIDNQNKYRWEKSVFLDKKNELILDTITALGTNINYIQLKQYTKIEDESNAENKFEEKKEEYIELWNKVSRLSIFYPNNTIYNELLDELEKLVHFTWDIDVLFSDLENHEFNKMKDENIVTAFWMSV